MKTLYIERSAGAYRDGDWVSKLDLEDVGRIVVGTGPGSFAGIRSAIAFAQGYALGKACEVMGLPSACGIYAQVAARAPQAAVIGDARQGKFWIALFDGFKLVKDVFQVELPELASAVPSGSAVISPDAARIGDLLKDAFGDRYLGEVPPSDLGLKKFAEANPDILKAEPLPIYLNPAVRTLSHR